MVGAQTILLHGATDRVGRELALSLARKGRSVFAVGPHRKPLEELRREARGLPLKTIQTNPSDPASVARLKQRMNRETQNLGPDVLVNNSGCDACGEASGPAGLRGMCAQLEQDIQGMVALIGAFAPQMRTRGWGRIVNICPTTAGARNLPRIVGRLCGDGAKAFSLAMAKELAPSGVQVVYVEPVPVRPRDGDAVAPLRGNGPGNVERRVYPREEASTAVQLFEPGVLVRAVEMAIRTKNPPGLWPAIRGDRVWAAVSAAIGDRWADQLVALLSHLPAARGRFVASAKSR